jgi:hypothetical protein
MPLMVLSAGHFRPPPSWTAEQAQRVNAWLRGLQRDLVHLSSNSVQIIALDSDHFIQLHQPDLLGEAIEQVLRAARHHSALPPLSAWRCGSGRCRLSG